MGLLSLTLPTIGQPNATEDSHVRDCLSSIQTEFNGNIDTTNLSSSAQQLLVPVGTIMAFGGSSAPSGYLLCDGSAVTRGSYSALFAVVGTSYGVGDGSTTFNLPDLRGRIPVGLGTNADVAALGDDEGVATVANRTPKHWHDLDPANVNIEQITNGAAGSAPYIDGDPNQFAGSQWINANTMIDIYGSAGVTTAAEDTPSYQVVNYIIKT